MINADYKPEGERTGLIMMGTSHDCDWFRVEWLLSGNVCVN